MTVEPLPEIPAAVAGQAEGHPLVAAHMLSTAQLVSTMHDVGKASPEWDTSVLRLLAARRTDVVQLRPVGRARKVSVSIPEDLLAAVQQRVGRGEFSQYVTEAVTRQLELDLLGDLADLLSAEHGPVTDEALAEARGSWPDAR